MAFRVGVLISGEGTNLQAILDTVHGREGMEVVCVGSSRPDAPGLERGRRAGVEVGVHARADHPDRDARDAALGDWLERHLVDLVVHAGFMEILGGGYVRRFEGRAINVHPSLLPAFPGLRAVERAVEAGANETGVTVHFVDDGMDTGPIILQEAFELPLEPDLAHVMRRVHEIEHRLLPEVVRLIATGAVSRDPADPRVVRVKR